MNLSHREVLRYSVPQYFPVKRAKGKDISETGKFPADVL